MTFPSAYRDMPANPYFILVESGYVAAMVVSQFIAVAMMTGQRDFEEKLLTTLGTLLSPLVRLNRDCGNECISGEGELQPSFQRWAPYRCRHNIDFGMPKSAAC